MQAKHAPTSGLLLYLFLGPAVALMLAYSSPSPFQVWMQTDVTFMASLTILFKHEPHPTTLISFPAYFVHSTNIL